MKRPLPYGPTMIVLAGLALAPLAAAAGSLYDNKAINNGLISVGIAIEISDKCSSIDPRTVRGLGYLSSLKRQARAQGFSDAQINAYIDDKAQKKKLEGQARAWLAKRGASGNEGHCKVGREEIAKNSQIGALLRAK